MALRASITGLVVLCFASLLLVSSFADETSVAYELKVYVWRADAGRKLIGICIPSPCPNPTTAPGYGGVPGYGGNPAPGYGGKP